MIQAHLLEESLIPGISISLKYWIMFTNQHHNGNRTTEQTIAKFKGTVIGEYINFDKLAGLLAPKPVIVKEPETVQPVLSIRERPPMIVTVRLDQEQAAELFNLLEQNKDEHPELHELVYQAMTAELFRHI